MTWMGQVRHVMAKDVREARWLVGAYLLVVAVSTSHALGAFGVPRQMFEPVMAVLIAVGMFVVAVMVQADAPTRPDAFWASHPLAPSAMFAAKVLLLATVVMVPPLAGQLAMISMLDLSGSAMVGILASCAYAYGMWLLGSLVVASVTRDVRSFVVVAVMIPVLLALVAVVLQEIPPLPGSGRDILKWFAVLGALVFVEELYRTRDARRRTWAAGFVVIACGCFATFAVGDTPARGPRSSFPPSQRATLAVAAPHRATLPQFSTLELNLQLDHVPANQRLTFIPRTVSVVTPNGSVVATEIENRGATLAMPDLPSTPRRPWPGTSDSSARVMHMVARLSAEQRAAAANGVNGAIVSGRIVAAEPARALVMPLSRGATSARDGVRVRIRDIRHDSTGAIITVRESQASNGNAIATTKYAAAPPLEYVLLNERLGDVRRLWLRPAAGANGGIVLPGSDLQDQTAEYGTYVANGVNWIPMGDGGNFVPEAMHATDGNERRIDDAWLRDAKLIVVRWTYRGSYPVTARVPIDSAMTRGMSAPAQGSRVTVPFASVPRPDVRLRAP